MVFVSFYWTKWKCIFALTQSNIRNLYSLRFFFLCCQQSTTSLSLCLRVNEALIVIQIENGINEMNSIRMRKFSKMRQFEFAFFVDKSFWNSIRVKTPTDNEKERTENCSSALKCAENSFSSTSCDCFNLFGHFTTINSTWIRWRQMTSNTNNVIDIWQQHK